MGPTQCSVQYLDIYLSTHCSSSYPHIPRGLLWLVAVDCGQFWSVMSITARQLTSGGQHSPNLRSRGRGVLPGSGDQETMCHHTLVILLSYPCHGVIFPAQPSSAHPAHSHDDNHRNGSSVWTPVDILLTHSNQYCSRRAGRSI